MSLSICVGEWVSVAASGETLAKAQAYLIHGGVVFPAGADGSGGRWQERAAETGRGGSHDWVRSTLQGEKGSCAPVA